MVWLERHAQFNPDAWPAPVLGIAAALGDHDSGLHQHGRGQLLYTRAGSARITLADRVCLLPPSRAVWIPPGVAHRAQMRQVVDYRSLYFVPGLPGLPVEVAVLAVSDLLAAVLEPMAQAPLDSPWHEGRNAHLLALCLDEIARAPQEPMLLPMPRDRRLARWLDDGLPPTLGELAARAGASERTIGRIMQKETGMGYQAWRQQWRLLRAIELLAEGVSLTAAAQVLGFADASAFGAFFRQMTGSTPRAYLAARR